MNSASRWPPSVVTSSPTTTSTRSPRSAADRPGGHGGIDPLVVGDGDDVEVGVALDVVEDRARRSPSRRWRRCGCAGRRGLAGPAGRHVAASDAAPALGRLRGRARSGRRPPTTARARVGHDPLERRGERRHRRGHPLAARALGRDRRRPRAGRGSASDAGPPDADHVERRAALDRQHRRAERQVRRCPEQRDREAAAGQVAIADQARPRSRRGARRAARGAPRAGRRSGRPAAPRVRTKQSWSACVVDRLHRRDGATDPRRQEERRAARSRRSGGRRR